MVTLGESLGTIEKKRKNRYQTHEEMNKKCLSFIIDAVENLNEGTLLGSLICEIPPFMVVAMSDIECRPFEGGVETSSVN